MQDARDIIKRCISKTINFFMKTVKSKTNFLVVILHFVNANIVN